MRREVPIGPADALCKAHDVIAQCVLVGTHHAVQHVVQVLGRGSVADEEEPRLPAHRPVWLGVSHHLKGLGLLAGRRTAHHAGNVRGSALPGLLDAVRLGATHPALQCVIFVEERERERGGGGRREGGREEGRKGREGREGGRGRKEGERMVNFSFFKSKS